MTARSILIIADIEGSTGCSCVEDSRLFNDGWVKTCIELSHDMAAVGRALQSAGVKRIRIKDFHRTGFNIFREYLPPDIELDQGYRSGPVPGIGDATGFDQLMMIGMHAASGTHGFIPHTLTSKFAQILVNGKSLTEAQLFAASVAPAGLAPGFFSGCQAACEQVCEAIPGIRCFTINKPVEEPPAELRLKLAEAAVAAAELPATQLPGPFCPDGPFTATIVMRNGATAAAKLRKRWQLRGDRDHLFLSGKTMPELYQQLINLAYLTPMTGRFIDFSLAAANLWGRLALIWAKRRARQLS